MIPVCKEMTFEMYLKEIGVCMISYIIFFIVMKEQKNGKLFLIFGDRPIPIFIILRIHKDRL